MNRQRREETFDLDSFVQLIQQGIDYETKYSHFGKADELFNRAGRLLADYYGETDPLYDFIHLYDYSKELHQGRYRDSILKLARAGNYIDQFGSENIYDAFTQWIFDNRNELLKEAVSKTWHVYQFLDVDFSIEACAAAVLLNIGNPMVAVKEMILDSAGLPHVFQYLLKDLLNQNQTMKTEDFAGLMEGVKYLHQLEKSGTEYLSQTERVSAAKKMMDYMEQAAGMPVGSDGLSSMLDSVLIRSYYTAAKGFSNLDEPDEADNYLKKLVGRMEDLEYSQDQIKIRLMECLFNHRLNDRDNAVSILNEVLECENDMVLQVFSIRGELKQLNYLSCLSSLLKSTIYACQKILGNKAAYTRLLRLRTLTADYNTINLNGAEGTEIVRERMQMESEKHTGKNMEKRLDEMQEWFDKKSQGIFECRAEDICRRLSNRMALLEFTRTEDESGRECYLVFVVLSNKVSALSLGACGNIDHDLDDIYNYMRIYSQQRFNPEEIRRTDSYRRIYEKLLVPLGEMLPSSLRSLYIVPEGGFGRIPFEVLPCFEWYDKYLGEEYEITYLNTGRELVYTAGRKKGTESIVIGAPDFSPCNQYPQIPASLHEVQRVGDILGVVPYTGTSAVATCIKGSPEILHISTHSYYENETEEELNDPMKRTGLVLAGGEHLSARDISYFDLHGTETAVLAICSEGKDSAVYNDVEPGIRRAFVNAGVRHLIMNLWKTDDNASDLFMECFYHYYRTEQMDIKKALKLTRQYLKESTVSQIRTGSYYHKEMEDLLSLFKEHDKPYSHPYYWAGFILIGE